MLFFVPISPCMHSALPIGANHSNFACIQKTLPFFFGTSLLISPLLQVAKIHSPRPPPLLSHTGPNLHAHSCPYPDAELCSHLLPTLEEHELMMLHICRKAVSLNGRDCKRRVHFFSI